MLAAAREKFCALSRGERAWKALAVMFEGVPAEHRAAVVERLCDRAASKPQLLSVVNAIAKALKERLTP
jgi:hypothetical protein